MSSPARAEAQQSYGVAAAESADNEMMCLRRVLHCLQDHTCQVLAGICTAQLAAVKMCTALHRPPMPAYGNAVACLTDQPLAAAAAACARAFAAQMDCSLSCHVEPHAGVAHAGVPWRRRIAGID